MFSNSPTKRVRFIQQQRCLRVDESGSGDRRNDLFPLSPILSSEAAPDDALLHPRLPFGQFSVCRKTRQLGAGPSATGRTVISLAWAKDKIPAVGIAGFWRAE